MKDRTTPKGHLSGASFSATLPEPYGEHHLVVPSAIKVARLFKMIDAKTMASLTHLSGQLSNPAAMLAVASQVGPEVLSVIGVLIGLAWDHTALELESQLDGQDYMPYGEAVFEELHEHGYPLESIIKVAYAVVARIVTLNTISSEAIEKMDFFGLGQGDSPIKS